MARRAVSEEKRLEWDRQRSQREAAMKDRLAEGVAALAQAKGWTQWLAFAGRMRRYSFTNQLLLLSQMPQSGLVLPAGEWRKVGRYPVRGSTALRVWAPAARRASTAEEDEAPAARPTRFVLVPVFDVSQTDGLALPQQPRPEPPPPGQAPAGMWDALVGFAADAGYDVGLGDAGGADGITRFDLRRIVVADRGSDLSRALVLVHEIAHMALHADPSARAHAAAHRGERELEAESTAYLVAAEYGLAAAAGWQFDYLANWSAAAGARTPQESADMVRAAAGRVLSAARPLLDRMSELGVGLDAAPAPAPGPPRVAARGM